MIKLARLTENIEKIRPYLLKYGGFFNDLTLGTRFSWLNGADVEYAIVNDTLILKELYTGRGSFFYPLGENAENAISEIEDYCVKKGRRLSFSCLTEEQADILRKRYVNISLNYHRDWCDYVYPKERFLNYSGKALSAQRNHAHKFNKLYPEYKVKIIEKDDVPRIKQFLKEYESQKTFSDFAAEEEKRASIFLDNMEYLGQFGAYIEINGKIAAFSVGEKINKTLFVHLEKGLYEYDGVYPVMAQAFARLFATEEIDEINREEDCGDEGLRISKTRYRPSELRKKYYFTLSSSFSMFVSPVNLSSERLTVTEIEESDKEIYRALYVDDEINKFYGYDYRKDLKGRTPDGDYFFSFMKNLKKTKREYSLAVRKNGEMIGEIVLYNFGFKKDAEIGFRFFKEFQGKGYAFESASAVISYLFSLGFTAVYCRHYEENERSERLILKLGFSYIKEEKGQKRYVLISE